MLTHEQRTSLEVEVETMILQFMYPKDESEVTTSRAVADKIVGAVIETVEGRRVAGQEGSMGRKSWSPEVAC